MAKQRVSTTVDADLLARARNLNASGTDASMVERALVALIERHRRAEIDNDYRKAWAEHPADEQDEWGDLAGFSEAVSSG